MRRQLGCLLTVFALLLTITDRVASAQSAQNAANSDADSFTFLDITDTHLKRAPTLPTCANWPKTRSRCRRAPRS